MKESYRLPKANLALLQERVDNLNKVARKLECEEISLAIIETEWIESKSETIYADYHSEIIEIVTVEISGSAPKLNGWSFAGTLEHLGSANIVRGIAGFEIPERFRTSPKQCDHCGLIRNRKDTYLVVKDGEWKQVGKSCLKDFTGHTKPEYYAQIATFLATLDDIVEECRAKQVAEYLASPERLLAISSAAIRCFGWTSKSAACEGHVATAHIVASWIGDTTASKGDCWRDIHGKQIQNSSGMPADTTPEDYEVARQALKWAQELEPGGSDYLWNIKALAEQEGWAFRQFGLAVSIIPAFKKANEEARARSERPVSQHVGEVGKRQEFSGLKLNATIAIDGFYGTTYLYKFEDEAGNQIVWFASSWQGFEDGEIFSGKATVKEHGEFRGEAQTIITRAKLESE